MQHLELECKKSLWTGFIICNKIISALWSMLVIGWHM